MNILSHVPSWAWARISCGTYYIYYILTWLQSPFPDSKMTPQWMLSAAVHVPASLPIMELSDFLANLVCTLLYGVRFECVWQPYTCISSYSYWPSGFPFLESVSPPWTVSPLDFQNSTPTTSLATSQPPLQVPTLLPSLLMLELLASVLLGDPHPGSWLYVSPRGPRCLQSGPLPWILHSLS